MNADLDDAGAASAIASNLARFPEEVDTAARPIHATRAIHQPARSADPVLQDSKDVVEPLQVIDALACTYHGAVHPSVSITQAPCRSPVDRFPGELAERRANPS